MAHVDELSMLVKRVAQDGSLHLTPLGTMYPGNFGLGPGGRARRSQGAVRSVVGGLRAYDEGEPSDLGDQA
jgi:putative aminopeptidase FrvX